MQNNTPSNSKPSTSIMRTLCDACESAAAIVFCAADEAALCRACDKKVQFYTLFFLTSLTMLLYCVQTLIIRCCFSFFLPPFLFLMLLPQCLLYSMFFYEPFMFFFFKFILAILLRLVEIFVSFSSTKIWLT